MVQNKRERGVIMGYSKEEQETTLVFDYSTGIWSVYSTVPKHIRKLANLCELNVIESENDRPIAVKGELTEKQVSMRNVIKRREMTEEEKQRASERLLKARNAQNNNEK